MTVRQTDTTTVATVHITTLHARVVKFVFLQNFSCEAWSRTWNDC